MRAEKRKFNPVKNKFLNGTGGVKKFFLFFILIVFSIFIFQAGSALANSKFIEGLDKTGEASGAMSEGAAADPGWFLAKMIGTTLAPIMMGVIAMLILSYGGYTLMTARGDEQKVEKAKAIITNTIIAVLVVFSAYAIVTLIIPLWEFVAKK